MWQIALAILMAGSSPGPIVQANPDQPAVAVRAPARTGKERLSDKASDEQRVDDCKVPLSRRTHPRPTACPRGVGS
jgi:hypothetical protein